MRIAAIVILAGAGWAAGPELGIWRMSPARSTFDGDVRPKSLTLRLEPHAKGAVFTMERIESDDRATSTSTILYLDGKSRDFEDFRCLGTQTSRRTDGEGVEIVRLCANGASTRFEIRPTANTNELILAITQQPLGGRRSEQRWILEKQTSLKGTR